jgi:hypothetical protein
VKRAATGTASAAGTCKRCRSWQALALRWARTHERELAKLIARHDADVRAKDKVIAKLRADLAEARGDATRKSGPSAIDVFRAHRALPHDMPQKEKQYELSEKFRCDARTIRRRLAEFEDMLAEQMGISLQDLRRVWAPRPSPKRR